MSRIPSWLYVLFGAVATILGALGVTHAPTGAPKIFWAVITVIGIASLVVAWTTRRTAR